MLSSFPHTLKRFGLDADVRVLLDLYRTFELGLVSNLGSLHDVSRLLVCKSKRDFAPYTLAFWEHFLGIDVKAHRTLNEAVRNSPAFEHWLAQQLATDKAGDAVDWEALVDRFLNEVMASDLPKNIIKELDAREHLDKDNPNLADSATGSGGGPPNRSDKLVDYSGISMEELLDRMKRVGEQQKTPHRGGGHWIGSHGHSPYGHSGQGIGGIRVGGAGHAGSARKVLGDPAFYPVDLDAPLSDDHLDAALQTLQDLHDSSDDRRLDVDRTVENTGRNAGIIVPHFLREQLDRTRVILLLDNGGNSMWTHARKVQSLFGKIKRRFPHDLKSYYFHNAIYDQVYEDEMRRKPVALRKLLEHSPDYRVFFVGDAYMGAHELLAPFGSIEYREESATPSVRNLKTLRDHFPYMMWLNPTPAPYWSRTVAPFIQEVMPMEPLTLHGIANAVRTFNQTRHF